MELSDNTTLTMKIYDLIELVRHIADGTEEGDGISQILVDATPKEVKEFIIESYSGWK